MADIGSAIEKSDIISALGAIRKCAINSRCQQTAGHALNDFATTHHFKYQSVQDAVELDTPGCYFVKLDLANAYRCVEIHPSNLKSPD